jgi:hypothetical protein
MAVGNSSSWLLNRVRISRLHKLAMPDGIAVKVSKRHDMNFLVSKSSDNYNYSHICIFFVKLTFQLVVGQRQPRDEVQVNCKTTNLHDINKIYMLREYK